MIAKGFDWRGMKQTAKSNDGQDKSNDRKEDGNDSSTAPGKTL